MCIPTINSPRNRDLDVNCDLLIVNRRPSRIESDVQLY